MTKIIRALFGKQGKKLWVRVVFEGENKSDYVIELDTSAERRVIESNNGYEFELFYRVVSEKWIKIVLIVRNAETKELVMEESASYPAINTEILNLSLAELKLPRVRELLGDPAKVHINDFTMMTEREFFENVTPENLSSLVNIYRVVSEEYAIQMMHIDHVMTGKGVLACCKLTANEQVMLLRSRIYEMKQLRDEELNVADVLDWLSYTEAKGFVERGCPKGSCSYLREAFREQDVNMTYSSIDMSALDDYTKAILGDYEIDTLGKVAALPFFTIDSLGRSLGDLIKIGEDGLMQIYSQLAFYDIRPNHKFSKRSLAECGYARLTKFLEEKGFEFA